MNVEQQTEKLRKQLLELGKEVAALHTTTKFPKWCLLKMGIAVVQGIPYENDFWQNRIVSSLDDSYAD
jgi:hypothetical protein